MEDKFIFDEWAFIEQFLPDYYHRDEVAENDDISKALHNEFDLNEHIGDEYILGLAAKSKEELQEMLDESNYALLKESMFNFLESFYPKQYKKDESMPH